MELPAIEPALDTVIIETRHGPVLAIRGDRYVTESLTRYGEFSPDELRLLSHFIKPGMTVVEVGANIGALSLPLARACAPGPIYLFEPQQRLFQLLCATLALNGVTNAQAHSDALGARPSTARIPPVNYANRANFGGVSLGEYPEGVRVRVSTLDSFDLAACHLLKIDVEGHELEVLRGAATTIARCQPLLYVENDRQALQGPLIDHVAGLGYRMYWHAAPLFIVENFKGHAENVFGRVASLNMLCLPADNTLRIEGLEPIDPLNWRAPILLRN